MKPTVKRFNQKKTYKGRTVKRTVVSINSLKRKGRKMKPMRAMKKGR